MENFLVLLSLIFLSFCSCRKPVACMSMGKETYYAGDVIQLNSLCSENAAYVKWIMPGGIEIANENFFYSTDETWSNYQFVISLEAYSRNGKRMDKVTKAFTLNPVYGQAVFYANDSSSDCGDIKVIYSKSTGTITERINFIPDCNTEGCAVLKVESGFYGYYATDSCRVWNGSLYVGKDDCKAVYLD